MSRLRSRPEAIPPIVTNRQHGYEQLRTAVGRGELVRIRPGAYRSPSAEQEWWRAEAAAELAHCVAVADKLTCSFMISHRSAARLFGWPVPRYDGTVDITQGERQSRCRGSDITRHHTALFREASVEAEMIEGLPVTPRWLTALDCARTFSPRDGLAVADAALAELAAMDKFARPDSEERQRRVRADLTERLRQLGPGRGVVRARSVLEHADGFAEFAGESRMRWLALAIGLPAPVCQWEVVVDGRRYFADATWLATASDWQRRAVCFEYDGEDKYGDTGSAAAHIVLREKAREDDIRSTDVGVHRVDRARLANHRSAATWMLSKFPPSTLAALTPRPALTVPGL